MQQAWQGFALDWSWWAVQQPGHLTRIAAGCQAKWEFDLMARSVIPRHSMALAHDLQPLVDRAAYRASRLHTFYAQPGEAYKEHRYVHGNLPSLLLRWLAWVPVAGDFVLIMDPDAAFLKRILPEGMRAAYGQPAGAYYAMDTTWVAWVPELCGKPCEWAQYKNARFAMKLHGYTPLMWHRDDLLPLVLEWEALVAPVHAKTNRLEAVMYAFIIACLRIHRVSIMHPDLQAGCMGTWMQPGSVTLHYCSSYKLADPPFFINKHWLQPHGNDPFMNLVDCGAPLLVDPPPPRRPADGGAIDSEQLGIFKLAAAMVTAVNAGLVAYKLVNCPAEVADYSKRIVIHEKAFDQGKGYLRHWQWIPAGGVNSTSAAAGGWPGAAAVFVPSDYAVPGPAAAAD